VTPDGGWEVGDGVVSVVVGERRWRGLFSGGVGEMILCTYRRSTGRWRDLTTGSVRLMIRSFEIDIGRSSSQVRQRWELSIGKEPSWWFRQR